MANDPKYVRLVDRLARGCRVDLDSGWSIAGLDVQPFPENNPLAARFVRNEIRAGNLESCSKGEYDEVMDQDHDYLGASGVEVEPYKIEGHYQEAHVMQLADAHRADLEASRGFASDGTSYKADQARRRAILKQQKASAGEDPDAEAEAEADAEAAAQEAAGGEGVDYGTGAAAGTATGKRGSRKSANA